MQITSQQDRQSSYNVTLKRVRATIVAVEKQYAGCPRRNVRDFGRDFLMLNYTNITQNTYIQS